MSHANEFQKKLLEIYACGDYAEMDINKILNDAPEVGDGLIGFLARELADEGDEKMNKEVAIKRLETAIYDIEVVLAAISS